MYAKFWKRFFDFLISLLAIVLLSPIFVILTVTGFISMKGNPFFAQERPGLHEKVFKLIKFRTMSNAKDKDGNYLPDEERLNSYGRFLRSTSLDELPELFNIIKGDMSLVGPRPLLVRYLPFYRPEERVRHSVRPGLTGFAQINGRNNLDWDKRLKLDIEYVDNISFIEDISIITKTIIKVLKRSDIASGEQLVMMDLDKERSWMYEGE